jgi:chromosome segregation ATPase
MSSENIERQIEFIINQQAQFSTDIIELKAQVAENGKIQAQASKDVMSLAANVSELTGVVANLTDVVANLTDDVASLTNDVVSLTNDVASLTDGVVSLTNDVSSLTDGVVRLGSQAEADRSEIRDAINNLIISNEVTRDFANKIAQLAVQTSQRVTNLESQQ